MERLAAAKRPCFCFTRRPTHANCGCAIHRETDGCQQLICCIERMETFVGLATAARKRLQLKVKLQTQLAMRLAGELARKGNSQVKHLFQKCLKQSGVRSEEHTSELQSH